MQKKRFIKRLIAYVLSMVMVVSLCINSHMGEMHTYAAETNVKMYIQGTRYATECKNLLTRINEIRKEAYDLGYVSSYVPAQWSSDMVEIAEIRAVEATAYMSHTRPNGLSCFSVTSSNGKQSGGENLAWYKSAAAGLEGWYNEKDLYAKYLAGDTSIEFSDYGHYANMISVSKSYIGLSAFKTNGNVTLAMETSSSAGKSSTYPSTASGSEKAEIEVPLSKLTNIKINTTSTLIEVGDTQQLTMSASYVGNGLWTITSTLLFPSVTWSSSDSSIVSVDTSGKIKGIKQGKATITATSSYGNKASIEVTIGKFVSSITLNSSSAQMYVGDTKALTATIAPTDATNKAVSWTSSNSNVATVSNTGVVIGKKAGTATITVAAQDGSGKEATCTVTVQNIEPTSVSIDSNVKTTFCVGDTAIWPVTVAPSNATDKTVGWQSGNSKVATVDAATGKITAVGIGSTYILVYARDANRIIDYKYINVIKPVTSISLNKSTASIYVGDTTTLTTTVAPTDASNTAVIWSSSNTSVATVSSTGVVTAKAVGTATITATAKDGSGKKATCTVTVSKKDDGGTTGGSTGGTTGGTTDGSASGNVVPNVTVTYRTHVQSYGWQGYVSNGTMSGTSGKSKRLEGINISVSGNPNLGVQYTTHVQSYGWLPWSSNGQMSGTEGESKRLEAIQIKLTGSDKDKYDIYYRVHAQSYGWLGWAKNGQSAGTAGYAKRLEGIQIVVVPKGEKVNDSVYGITSKYNTPYISNTGVDNEVSGNSQTNVLYRTHVQTYGWQGWKYNGIMSGTSGEAKRLEGIEIKLSNQQCTGGITYRTHVQTYGWQNWKTNGVMSGTSGQAKRLEAIEIKLTGEMANNYDVYYRVHAQTFGWLDWAKNGESAGTAGLAKRLEGIQIVLVRKGEAAPGNTNRPFVSAK